jgi:hypothetical protein
MNKLAEQVLLEIILEKNAAKSYQALDVIGEYATNALKKIKRGLEQRTKSPAGRRVSDKAIAKNQVIPEVGEVATKAKETTKVDDVIKKTKKTKKTKSTKVEKTQEAPLKDKATFSTNQLLGTAAVAGTIGAGGAYLAGSEVKE